jgi:hypothetical protein
MRDAVLSARSSRLGAALLLTPFAATMSSAVRCAATNSPLGAAVQLTLPPAHGTPPSSLHVLPPKPNSLRCAVHSHHPPPLSPQRSASAYRTPYTRRWQCESRSDVGCSMSRSRWSTALGRGTYGECVVGQDGQGLTRTLHRQVRRLLARRAASPNPDVRFEHTPLHTATRRPQHDGGTPWSEPAVLRVRVCERAAPVVDKNPDAFKTISFSAPVQVGVTSIARRASLYMHIHRCASRVFSVRRTPLERPEARL